MSNLKLDHFFIACFVLLCSILIAALVILSVTSHSDDITRLVGFFVDASGFLSIMAGVQSIRTGVGKANDSIENGVLKGKVKDAIEEYFNSKGTESDGTEGTSNAEAIDNGEVARASDDSEHSDSGSTK